MRSLINSLPLQDPKNEFLAQCCFFFIEQLDKKPYQYENYQLVKNKTRDIFESLLMSYIQDHIPLKIEDMQSASRILLDFWRGLD